MDELIAEATGYPSVRFVERCGVSTIADLLGRANPWAKHWMFDRSKCLPCHERALLHQKQAEKDLQAQGEVPKPLPGKEKTMAIPKCTKDSVGYVLECCGCRRGGKYYTHVRETSSSP